MEMRCLGNSGLEVSVFGFGTMTFSDGDATFGGVGATRGNHAKRQIGLCLDAGVNLFDTADVYAAGRSEEILAEALGDRRKDVVVATKAFGRMEPNAHNAGLSRRHLIEACNASLKRLISTPSRSKRHWLRLARKLQLSGSASAIVRDGHWHKRAVEERFGRVDVLVNNAEISPDGQPVADINPVAFDRVIAIKLTGTFNGIATIWCGVRDRGDGHIVSTALMAGLIASAKLAPKRLLNSLSWD